MLLLYSCCQYGLGLMSLEAFCGVAKPLGSSKGIKWLFFGLLAELNISLCLGCMALRGSGSPTSCWSLSSAGPGCR